jgi:hypothetical protein
MILLSVGNLSHHEKGRIAWPISDVSEGATDTNQSGIRKEPCRKPFLSLSGSEEMTVKQNESLNFKTTGKD